MSNNLPNYGSSYSSLIFYFSFYVLFLSKGNVLKITTKFCVLFSLFHNIVARVLVCLYNLLLMLSDDVEINPGPSSNCKESFSICHWNLNSISAHDYFKLFCLKAYIIIHILYFSAKLGNRIRCSFFLSFKLSSSDCFCKISFENLLPTTIFKTALVFQRSRN